MSHVHAGASAPSRWTAAAHALSETFPRTNAASWRYDLAAAVCCVSVLVAALVAGHFHRVGNFGVESDFYATYAVQAKNLMAGKPYTFMHHPPGYPLLLAAVSSVTGDLFLAGKLISAFSAALLGWVAYLLLKALFGRRVAFAATALTMLRLAPFSFLAATDVVGALLMTLPIWVLLRRPRLTWTSCFLGGVVAGVAYLVRANGIFVVAGLGGAVLCVNLNHEPVSRRAGRAALFACGALLVTLHWFLMNWKLHGSPFASTEYLQIGAHFFGTINDALGTSLAEAETKFHSLWDVVSLDPLGMAGSYLNSVLNDYPRELASHALMFPAYVFVGIGALLVLTRLSRRRRIFLGVYALGYLLLGLAGFQLRLYFFLFPVLFVFAAYALLHHSASRALGRSPLRNVAVSWLMVALLAGALAVNAAREIGRTLRSDPVYLFPIAAFLRSHASPDTVVIAQKPHLAYLAGMRWTFPMAQSAEEFLEKARELGARYVVYSDREASLWRGLKSLRDPGALPAGLTVIYRHDPSHTLIYEVDAAREPS